MPKPLLHRSRSLAYTACGFVFCGLGIAGYLLPLMPGTVFLLIAVWCFAKGNSRFESWLLDHRVFGKTLRDWREHRAMTRRAKSIAISTVWVSMGVSALVLGSAWVALALFVLAIALTALLATRRTRPTEP